MAVRKSVSRRRFLALTGAVAAGTALRATAAPAVPARAGAMSLAGEWHCALDRADEGMKQGWFARVLPTSSMISLPGILQAQGYGDEISVDTPWVAALPRDMRWYLLPQYAAYTKPGHVQMPYLSQPPKHYLGVAWYQREIEVPQGWSGKRVSLTLERTRWETTVYVDDKEMGSCRSLVAPHDYDIGLLAAGKHRLTIRIDNRMLQPPYRADGHGVSDHEGATWNGVVGRIELAATSPVWIDDAQVYPDVAKNTARIKVKIGNASGAAGSGTLAVGAQKTPVSWSATGGDAEIDVAMPHGTALWSEFTPVLQRLTVMLKGDAADDKLEVTFGMREIRTDGNHIFLNGELFHFRATHDGGGFPLTGYPATDVATWKRIVSTCKAWGLNGIRFHSWCPPESAFVAADELGFYLQPECGMWNSFDAEGKMLAVLNDETARLLKAFGNHPSLVLLNATNEPAGHYAEQLPTWDKKWHDADPRRLYSDGTGRFAPPPGGAGHPYAADYLVTPGARGPRGWFGADYESTLQGMLRGAVAPCIGHEVGQWTAYPDFDVIKKFTGYLQPGNYRIWRDFAEANHVLAKNKEMAHASGRFQVACFKEEIEASLRTPGYSGYELLDLHDYLGQGGALIGLLDAFWEPKSYVGPAEFRQYCNTTVPLARLKERVFRSNNTLKADVEVAHYGHTAIAQATAGWRIVSKGGKTVASGQFAPRAIPRGKNIALGTIAAELGQLPAPAQYKLVVELGAGTTFRNEWNFWLYPTAVEEAKAADVLVTRSWAEAETRLATGGRVLFVATAAALDPQSPKVTTVPIFWNHLMNPNGTTFMGLLVDQHHRALAGFPTEANCDWQWVDLFSDTRALDLTTLPVGLEPIVQSIDDWNRSLKLALMYECKVGPGRLMVSSLDVGAATARAGTASLRRSVLSYMQSAEFKPATAVGVEVLRAQYGVARRAGAKAAQPLQPTSPDLVDPGQVRRRP
jgi:beta-galactosidase